MSKRTYVTEMRTFEITLGTPALNHSSWTVETVTETTSDSGKGIAIPTMEAVVASTEDEAYARACDRIDKWLISNR